MKRKADIVRLNVGGSLYDTSPSTLQMSLYFQPFLDGRMRHGEDVDGRLFIDRDGNVFATLLNFMRTTKLFMPQKVIEDKRPMLMAEADFFGLDWLLHRLKGEISIFDFAPNDKHIRNSEISGQK